MVSRLNINPLVMRRNSFKFLFRALRFDDVNARRDRKFLDRLAAIRDEFVENFQKNHVVSDFISIDEMLESFRG